MTEVIKNKYEFVVLSDVKNGNPNDDPDAGNLSGIDPKDGCGIVTDMCLERKIRNCAETLERDEPGYEIYIREDVSLDRSDSIAYIEFKTDEKGIKELKRKDLQVNRKVRDFMCRNFFDIRAFGTAITTFVKAALNCGQVHRPIQLGFVRSIDPIVNQEVTITRVVITTEEDMEGKSTEMGRKNTIPYTLYRAEGYIPANLARESTSFLRKNLELLWDAIVNIFGIDYSVARGRTAVRRLIVFKHSKELGDCPTYKLSDVVEVKKNKEVEYPRKYGDCTAAVRRGQIPEVVKVSERM